MSFLRFLKKKQAAILFIVLAPVTVVTPRGSIEIRIYIFVGVFNAAFGLRIAKRWASFRLAIVFKQ